MFVWTAILIIRVSTVSADHVHISRDDQTEDLFACPQRLGFKDSWLWDLAIPVWNPHHQIHHCVLKIKCMFTYDSLEMKKERRYG